MYGLMIKSATGAVIDATLIESTARPKKTITLEMDSEGKAVQFEDGGQPGISCTEEHKCGSGFKSAVMHRVYKNKPLSARRSWQIN